MLSALLDQEVHLIELLERGVRDVVRNGTSQAVLRTAEAFGRRV
jgi:hypothetical protein